MGNVFKNKETPEAKFFRPNGLYPLGKLKCDPKTMKKLISDKKIAPFYVGTETPSSPTDEECPICMLNYVGGLNRARCCKKGVCTECYFSIRPAGATSAVDCPFCQQSGYTAVFTGPLSSEERQKMIDEERKVQELEKKMREEEIERDRQRELEKKKKLAEEQMKREQEKKKEEAKEHTRMESECRKKKNDNNVKTENKEEQKTLPNVNLNASVNNNVSAIPPTDLFKQYEAFMSQEELDDPALYEAIRLSLLDSQQVNVSHNPDPIKVSKEEEINIDQASIEDILEEDLVSDECLYSDNDDGFASFIDDNSHNSDEEDEVYLVKKRREK